MRARGNNHKIVKFLGMLFLRDVLAVVAVIVFFLTRVHVSVAFGKKCLVSVSPG